MQIFKENPRKALNHDLTLPLQSTRRELPESSGILEKGLICVELWSFYCSKRISVPMSYISGGSWRYIAGELYRGSYRSRGPEGAGAGRQLAVYSRRALQRKL